MIYAASLGSPLKKAYGDKCYVTSVTTITENMKLDSSVSGMDVCVFGPKDVVGINRTKVQAWRHNGKTHQCVLSMFTQKIKRPLCSMCRSRNKSKRLMRILCGTV